MRKMVVEFLGMKSHARNETFHYFLTSDLVCFIVKLIKSAGENKPCDNSDSSSCSAEISETEIEDILNQDSHDDKIKEMENDK